MKREMILSTYQGVRGEMQPGDLIAFGGTGWFSRIIKFFTMSPVSHVGVVLEWDTFGRVMIMEATSLDGFKGVQVNRLSSRVAQYDGHVWWMPLSDQVRAKLNVHAMVKYMWAQDGKKYDTKQAIKSAIPFWTRENDKRMFCSELVSRGYEQGGIIKDVNSSEMTPDDVCHFPLYKQEYHQIKMHNGERKEAL